MIFARSSLSFAASAVLCACALLSLSTVCVSAQGTLRFVASTVNGALETGGTTYGKTEAVTLTVAMDAGTVAPVNVVVTCGDASRGTYTAMGGLALSADPSGGPGKMFTVPMGPPSMSGSIIFTPADVADSPYITCSVEPASEYDADEFGWYPGVRALVAVTANPVVSGVLTAMSLTLLPANALSLSGATSIVWDPICGASLDVLEPMPARRRLLATSYPRTMISMSNVVRFGLRGPAVPQPFSCSFPFTPNSGTLATDLAVIPVKSITMEMPQPPAWTSFPATIDLASTYNLTLTLSQANVGGLTLSGSCFDAVDVFPLGDFVFLDGEDSRTFPVLGSLFGAQRTGVQCRMSRVAGDAFWTNMANTANPPGGFNVVGTLPASSSSSSGTSGDSASSSGSSDSSSSTATEGAQSSSSTAAPASSSSGPDGASSSTGGCIPGLTCAALASVRSSWSLIALAAVAVLVGLTQ